MYRQSVLARPQPPYTRGLILSALFKDWMEIHKDNVLKLLPDSKLLLGRAMGEATVFL